MNDLRSFWPADDGEVWPTEFIARVLLDMPARFNLMLHLPWEASYAPLFDRRTEAMLRIIAKGDYVPGRKLARTLKEAGRDVKDCWAALDHMFTVMRLFHTMAFTREQLETMPEGYRREMIAQRRRRGLRVIPHDDAERERLEERT
jgi:hypothetical protein